VIVLDALDEADDGVGLMKALLLPLATARRPDGLAAVRLLIGVRRWDEYAPLLNAARAVNGLVDLDDVQPDVLADDLYNYVSDLLRSVDQWRRRGGAVGEFATEVSEVLSWQDAGRREWGEFLVAGLYTRYLLTIYPEPPAKDGEAAALGARAPQTLPEVLDLDLDAHEKVPLLRPVITTLAYARGQGMPLTVLIRLVATEAHGGAEVQRALTAGRFYLRQSTDTDGSVLYRLFHQGLADYLRQVPQSGLFDRLLGALGPVGSQDWLAAEPYMLRHALEHAVEVGRVEEVLAEPSFLLTADPATLVPLLIGKLADVYSTSLDVSSETVRVNRAALALNAVRAGMSEIAASAANPPGEPPLAWQPQWAVGPATPRTSGLAWDVTWPGVYSLAIDPGIGEALLGTDAGEVLRVEIATGRLCKAITFRPDGAGAQVTAIKCVQVAGFPLAVVTVGEGGRFVVDLTNNQFIATGDIDDPLLAADPKQAASLIIVGRSFTKVSGDAEGTVQIQDAGTTVQVLPGLHVGPMTAVACQFLNGQPLAFTGGQDGKVQVIDLLTRQIVDTINVSGPVFAIEATADGDLLVGADTEVLGFRHISAVNESPGDRRRLMVRLATYLGRLEASRRAGQQ
jgi:hypothetical protein